MFQIASTIGIAINNGNTYGFPYWLNYDALERFMTTEDIDMQKYFLNPLPLIPDGIQFQDYNANWGYNNIVLPSDFNVNIIGHLQSEKYFEHCADTVKHFFEMKKPDKYFEVDKGSVAIHIRLGDYENNYHPIMSVEYYSQAIEIMKKKGCEKFYVFSDEIEKAKTILGAYSGSVIFVDGISTMADFYSMQQCAHFIIANSTYSWWAAWLSKNKNKIVIAPTRWFGEIAGISSEDIYCKNWIKI